MLRALEKLAESAANRFGAGVKVDPLRTGSEGGVGNLSASTGCGLAEEAKGGGVRVGTISTGGGLAEGAGGGSWPPLRSTAHLTEIVK